MELLRLSNTELYFICCIKTDFKKFSSSEEIKSCPEYFSTVLVFSKSSFAEVSFVIYEDRVIKEHLYNERVLQKLL